MHFLALNDRCSLNANEWPFILGEEGSKKGKLVAKGDISHAHTYNIKQTARHTSKEIIVLWLFWFSLWSQS